MDALNENCPECGEKMQYGTKYGAPPMICDNPNCNKSEKNRKNDDTKWVIRIMIISIILIPSLINLFKRESAFFDLFTDFWRIGFVISILLIIYFFAIDSKSK